MGRRPAAQAICWAAIWGTVLLFCPAASALEDSNVLVVYDQASSEGSAVAAYYQQVHPGVQLLPLDLSGIGAGEVVSADDYLNVIRPAILSAVTPSIDCIVTTRGLPLRIYNPWHAGSGVSQWDWRAYSSLESELTRIDTIDSRAKMGDQNFLPFIGNPLVPNPYVGVDGPFSHAAYGIRLASRLDGFSVADVTAAVDRARYAVTLGTEQFVVDDDPDAPATSADRMPALHTELQARGIQHVYDQTDQFIAAASGRVLGYVSHGTYGGGSPAQPPNTPSYVLTDLALAPADGAVFHTYESFNACSFNEGGNRQGAAGYQALVAEWIAAGGTAGLGHVEEPGASSPGVTNELQVIQMLLDGYTWAEAAWSGTFQLSYVNAVVGDPLMRWLTDVTPGDANLDGIVDNQDFAILKSRFGQSPAHWGMANFNPDQDTVVDTQDFAMLKANITLSQGPSVPPEGAPEPATALLLAVGASGIFIRRKR